MKKLLWGAALVLTAAAVQAQPGFGPTYLPAEVKALAAEHPTEKFGDLPVTVVAAAAERLDIARQKDEFVLHATLMSAIFPGAGQFASGDAAGGSLGVGLNLAILAGTAAAAYSVLPADLRFDRLNYTTATDSQVEAAWGAHSLKDYGPAIGALSAGALVQLALRIWSARDARQDAVKAIDAGAVKFEPRFDGGHFGWGMRY